MNIALTVHLQYNFKIVLTIWDVLQDNGSLWQLWTYALKKELKIGGSRLPLI